MGILKDLGLLKTSFYFNLFTVLPQADTSYITENLNNCLILSFRQSANITENDPESDRTYIIKHHSEIKNSKIENKEKISNELYKFFKDIGTEKPLPISALYVLMYKYNVDKTILMEVNRQDQCFDICTLDLNINEDPIKIATIYLDYNHAMVLNFYKIVINLGTEEKNMDYKKFNRMYEVTHYIKETEYTEKDFTYDDGSKAAGYDLIYNQMLRQDISMLLRPIIYDTIHYKNGTITKNNYDMNVAIHKKKYPMYKNITNTEMYKTTFGEEHTELFFSDVTLEQAKDYLNTIDKMYRMPEHLLPDSRSLMEIMRLWVIIKYIVGFLILVVLAIIGIYFLGVIVNIIILIRDYKNGRKYTLKYILYNVAISWLYPLSRYVVGSPNSLA